MASTAQTKAQPGTFMPILANWDPKNLPFGSMAAPSNSRTNCDHGAALTTTCTQCVEMFGNKLQRLLLETTDQEAEAKLDAVEKMEKTTEPDMDTEEVPSPRAAFDQLDQAQL